MKVNSILIEKYLSMVTESRSAALENPAEDLADYDEAIDRMGKAAQAAGDDDLLRMSIDALVARPEGRLWKFAGSIYRWPNSEFVPLLTRAHERLWPDFALSEPGDEPEIEFEEMTSEEWATYSGRG